MKKPPKSFTKQMEKMYPKGATITPTKKLKRFEGGGEVEVRDSVAAKTPDQLASEAGETELKRIRDESADSEDTSSKPEYKSFKEAFAANRKAGVGTFEYNGKKYTTELAGSRKEAAPAAKTSTSIMRKETTATPSRNIALTSDAVDKPEMFNRSSQTTTRASFAEKAAPKGRGVIDTSNIGSKTLLPKRANGGVVARSTVKSHGKAC